MCAAEGQCPCGIIYMSGPLRILNELVKAKSSFGLNSIFGSFFVEVAAVEIGCCLSSVINNLPVLKGEAICCNGNPGSGLFFLSDFLLFQMFQKIYFPSGLKDATTEAASHELAHHCK